MLIHLLTPNVCDSKCDAVWSLRAPRYAHPDVYTADQPPWQSMHIMHTINIKGATSVQIIDNIGDFNDVAWSESTQLYKEVSELLDLRIGRGLFNTFSANSKIMRWPLDHIFVSEHFRAKEVLRGNDVGSDHFPAYAELTLESDKKDEQTPSPPSENQLKRAYQIIEKEATQKSKTQFPLKINANGITIKIKTVSIENQ